MTYSENFSNLKIKEKILILVCGLVAIWSIGGYYFVEPQFQLLLNEKELITAKQKNTNLLLKQLDVLKNTVPTEKNRILDSIKTKKMTLIKLITQVDSESRKALLSDINLLTHELILKAHLIEIQQLETAELADRDETLPNYRKQQINVLIKGEYKQLAAFLSNLKMSEHIFMLDEYALDATQHPDVFLSLKINTYLEDVE